MKRYLVSVALVGGGLATVVEPWWARALCIVLALAGATILGMAVEATSVKSED